MCAPNISASSQCASLQATGERRSNSPGDSRRTKASPPQSTFAVVLREWTVNRRSRTRSRSRDKCCSPQAGKADSCKCRPGKSYIDSPTFPAEVLHLATVIVNGSLLYSVECFQKDGRDGSAAESPIPCIKSQAGTSIGAVALAGALFHRTKQERIRHSFVVTGIDSTKFMAMSLKVNISFHLGLKRHVCSRC